jgi:site-specific DNA-cytosine methylase
MTVGGLFDGVGLLAYGLHLAGFEHRWLCEKDEFRARILKQRFPGVPVYRDVRDVGAGVEPVDLVAGGFPCKGASVAGRREGFGHPETALWREQLRIVRELRPRYVLVENVAALLRLHRGECFGEVVGGLAAIGYDAEWDCFPAAAFGAPHGRDRVFVTAVADSALAGLERAGVPGAASNGSAADAGRLRELSDGELYRGNAGGGNQPGLAALPARQEGAFAANPVADRAGVAADSYGDRLVELATLDSTDAGVDVEHRDDADGRGVRVEWGRYAGAIRRWENIVGRPAPEPLIRRVDDGRTGRVERSRLSALGDGVLVEAGWFAGRRIMIHAEDAA